MNYIIILGAQSDLAQEEISKFFENSEGKIRSLSPRYAIVESRLEPDKLMSVLGSAVKIAQLSDTIDNLYNLSEEKIFSILDITTEDKKKICFGFSLYDSNQKTFVALNKLFLGVKKLIRQSGNSARFVTSKQPELSSVIVKKNNLLGKEVIFVRSDNSWNIGLTLAVQDFESYQLRDMGRPARDDKSGMLPPKLAQSMINLAGSDRDRTLLDPFCGSGTILQEAALLGFNKIIGTDSNKTVVNNAKKNIDWFKEKFKITCDIDFRLADVRRLGDTLARKSVDLVVCEPYLGPSRLIQRTHRIKELVPIKAELQELYILAFKNFYDVLKPKSKIIFAFPIFNIAGQTLAVLDKEKIEKIGFKLIKPRHGSALSAYHNIVYTRPDQKVMREITMWQTI